MAPTPNTYDELAQEILRGYLRSAVIIDDQWPEIAIGEGYGDESDESALIDDRIPDDIEMASIESPASDLPPPRPPDSPDDARLLVELQRSFLREGLLACGFRYTNRARKVAIDLARRADIVVLDWDLANDKGADALVILEELRGNGLRFVCIFTGHGRVQEVRHALENRFGTASGDPEAGEADLRLGNLVIAIRNKKGLGEGTPEFIVESHELLAAALGGLASNYNGLVQLTVLELTQQHRRQLPAILERFDKSIDTAVLLEAGDESSPVGRGGAFLAILVDEWRAHLEQEQSRLFTLGEDGLSLFGSHLAKRSPAVSAAEMQKALTGAGIRENVAEAFAKKSTTDQGREKLNEWIAGGCKGRIPATHGDFKEGDKRCAGWGALQAISGSIEEPAYPLLRLDALFHQQFEPPVALTQGTLVARSDHYFLCITPACDAERPETLANLFTFLRTKSIPPVSLFSSKSRKAAYCVVEFEKRLLCLEVLLKQRLVLEVDERMFDGAGTVRGRLAPGVQGDAGLVQLQRIAQLRLEHALSITAAAAADASRVGVNRVEMVRSRLS